MPINRFRNHPNFERHSRRRYLDARIGAEDWILPLGKRRRKFFYNLYKSQLKKSGAKYTVHFELISKTRGHVYTIFFGTRTLGRLRQDEATAPFGRLILSGSSGLEEVCLTSVHTWLTELADFSLLEKDLSRRSLPAAKGWQKIEDVEDFVKSDATDFQTQVISSVIPCASYGG